MDGFYLELIPTFQSATQQILQLPVDAKRRLHAATKYNGKNTKLKPKRKTRKKNVK